MGKVSYSGKNLTPLLGTKLHTVKGEGITTVEIQMNPKTGLPAFKVGTAYLPNVNQVGWYLMGKLDETKADSGFRPKHLVDNSGTTLEELRKQYTVKGTVSPKEPKTVYKQTKVYENKKSPEPYVSRSSKNLADRALRILIEEHYFGGNRYDEISSTKLRNKVFGVVDHRQLTAKQIGAWKGAVEELRKNKAVAVKYYIYDGQNCMNFWYKGE